ncbi:MAG TPA: hypothetical protein VK363_01725 [Pyrinomonadaceae bacterium]|nr:hypothetical protein [Pyrinomonadaceae bacterium]
MTGDEMERAIEFLLKNQADFEARFEAEREQTNQQIRELAVGQQQIKENLDQLSQIVAQNTQQINHLSEVMVSVVEGQQSNKDDIDALVKLVGGLIEGRRNGKSES